MHFRLLPTISLLSLLLPFTPFASALRLLESKSLNPCQEINNFTASLFNVVFTPDNGTIAFDIVGVSSIQGNVTVLAQVIAYGYTAVNETIDPCTAGLGGFCPMSTGQINIQSNLIVSQSVVKKIPGIAYDVPDLDGLVRIYIRLNGASENAACVQAVLSNGKSVYQKAVGWVTAIIAGLALIASAVTSGLGHSNTAAHVAANALSLFGFFQAQAIIGMTAVAMPPIVESWTQNFQWSMGIIRVGFLQSICTWYQRATGGTPSVYLSTLATSSVEVQKRSIEVVGGLIQRGANVVLKRSAAPSTTAGKLIVVSGIDRVGFQAGIEQTNIFMTGLIFFIVFCFFVAILVALFKAFCEAAVKAGWMKSDKFSDFRNGWRIVLKGILFRLVLIGYPQMCILCLWELVERDSAAEVVLALIVFCSMTLSLGWAALKVIRLAKHSVVMHKNPAYMLYSDPTRLNKWGFLYVQYRATAYYFVLPVLAYILVKAIFIAFCQGADVVQAVGLVIIEAVALIGVSVLRPWMDKKTNVFNISIAAINFINVIFLLLFTQVFGQPAIVTGVMGVLFALYNVIFAAVLLILVLIASVYAIASKNPDTRYQPMRDDRGSFIKSQSALTTELDALGATARGDTKEVYGKERGFGSDDDDDSSSDSLKQRDPSGVPLPPSTASSAYRPTTTENPAMLPSDNTGRRGPPANPNSYDNHSAIIDAYNDEGNGQEYHSGYSAPPRYQSGYSNGYQQTGSVQSYHREGPQFRQANNSSPWQRGAGYD